MKFRTTGLASALIITSIALCHAGDVKITLHEAPAAIQKAIKEQAGSHKLLRLEKANESGQIQYEALTQKADGKKIEYILNADGTLDSTEEPISMAELPSPVADAVKKAVNGASVNAVERVTKDGKTTYEIAYTSNKSDMEAVVSSEGKLLKNGRDSD